MNDTYPNTTPLVPAASLDARIEALLFASGTAFSRTSLTRLLACSDEELAAAIAALTERIAGGGTALIETDGAIALVTAPAVAATVALTRAAQTGQDIGQAGLEVLAIILYHERPTRSAIDYIRGVNSAATIRLLMMRGLIEKTAAKGGGETETAYRATPAAFAHLGVTHASDLPQYDDVRREIASHEARAGADDEPERAEEASADDDAGEDDLPYDSQ